MTHFKNTRITFLPPVLLLAAALIVGACGQSTAEETVAEGPTAEQVAIQEQLEARAGELAERQEELSAQAEDLARLTGELEDQKGELDARRAALRESEARIASRERQLSAQLAEIDQRLADLEAREKRPQPVAEERPEPPPAPVTQTELLRPRRVTVPAGTLVEVEFLDDLSSRRNYPGDVFRTRVLEDVTAGGIVAIPAGSEILGEVVEAVPLGRKVGGQARLAVRFTDLVPVGGGAVPIDATYGELGRNERGRDAATIGGATAGGAILGRVLDDDDRGRGTLIGAIIGAAAGTAIAARSGEEVEIPAGTWARLELEQAVTLERR